MEQTAITRDLRRMAPLAILVIGLHAALLTIPLRSARPDRALAESGQVHVRLLSAPFVQAPAVPSTAQPPLAAEVAEQALPAQAVPPRPVAEPAPPRVEPASVSPPAPAFGLVVPGADRDAEYFPRALLSLAPIPLDTVVIDYPTIEKDGGHHVSELTLFIEETGRVARVRVDGPSLPPALEEAARRAFVDAKFRPGEAQGRAVKSQIRVEVVFDNRPPARP